MANISIKDVPEPWAEALRQRAARNHRSLQGELMSLIEQALSEPSDSHGSAMAATQAGMPASGVQVAGLDRLGHPVTRRGSKTIEQIAAEHRLRFPQPIKGGPLAVDIIRADRDTR
jgi:plasmid stability protein